MHCVEDAAELAANALGEIEEEYSQERLNRFPAG
jgi:hypothetical protein